MHIHNKSAIVRFRPAATKHSRFYRFESLCRHFLFIIIPFNFARDCECMVYYALVAWANSFVTIVQMLLVSQSHILCLIYAQHSRPFFVLLPNCCVPLPTRTRRICRNVNVLCMPVYMGYAKQFGISDSHNTTQPTQQP